MNNQIDFGQALYMSLAACKYTDSQLNKMMSAWSTSNQTEESFTELLDMYGNETKASALARLNTSYAGAINLRPFQTPVGAELESALTQANKQTVSTNAVQRTRAAIKRYRDNLAKVSGATLCSTFTRGAVVSILSDEELNSLQGHTEQKDNSLNLQYQSWASWKSQH
jgi:hypothetical protein